MTESILNSTKKVLGIEADYTDFDMDITMFINSTFSTLEQLGIGPTVGFMISDSSTPWDSFLHGDQRLNFVKTYIYLKVRLLFDPPSVGHAASAMEQQTKEFEWRINVLRENAINNGEIPPNGYLPVLPTVIDGGKP